MINLYSYVVAHDTGFAPNPFGNYCTLACCKPDIRKAANVGDWVVGTGSKKNDESDKIIYAMKVTEKKDWDQRNNIFHGTKDTNCDLGGIYVLISNDFYYFGKKAIDLDDGELKDWS